MKPRKQHDEAWLEALRQDFKRHVEALDYPTRARLAAARRRALAAAARPPLWRQAWLPAGALAAAALAVSSMLLWPDTGRAPAPVMAEDFEIMLSEEDLALYAELDFYLWLGAQEDAG